MSAQPRERLHGELAIQGYYKDESGDGFESQSVQWNASSVSVRFFVANRKYRIKAANATVTAAGTDGGGATAIIYKVPSGTAMASGSAIHSGTANLQGTANTNQALTLSATSSVLDMDRGDALAIVFTGVLTNATGVASVALAPM